MQLDSDLWKPKQPAPSNSNSSTTHFMLASLVLNLVLLLALALQGSFPAPKVVIHQDESNCQATPCSFRSTSHTAASDSASMLASGLPVNLDHGDPTMFEAYWMDDADGCATVILGWEQMSYFASKKQHLWFVESDFEKQIRALHALVGNAVTDNRFIVVGTGSTQLFQAALYAVSPRSGSPASVVSAIPYYSSYPVLTDYLESGIHKWAGDATEFKGQDGQYVELVTCPNNPDGTLRAAVVNGSGPVIHDLAYYWPHYTPISSAANHDIMLFTASKSTGHAGTRIGWAIVKDEQVAHKMAKFIELNTIGVSHDSQLRAAQVLKSIIRGYQQKQRPFSLNHFNQQVEYIKQGKFFHFGYSEMQRRWKELRAAIAVSKRFSLPDFTPGYCSFFGQLTNSYPAFAWLRCNREEDNDCRQLLHLSAGLLTRSGTYFGVGPEYVRISMLDRHHNFQTFISRLSALASENR